jgi:hypothetical protein
LHLFSFKCEEQFEAAVSLLTRHPFLRFYKMFAITGFAVAVGGVLAAITVTSLMAIFNVAVLICRSEKIISDATIPLTIFLGIVEWFAFIILLFVQRKKVKISYTFHI